MPKGEIDDAKENLKEDAQETLATVLKITVMVLCGLFFLLLVVLLWQQRSMML